MRFRSFGSVSGATCRDLRLPVPLLPRPYVTRDTMVLARFFLRKTQNDEAVGDTAAIGTKR